MPLRTAFPRRRQRSRSYGPGWSAFARRVVDAWIARNGMVCPGAPELGHGPHAVSGEGGERLTADHRVPWALGGTADDGVRVLCQAWNTRRGQTTRLEVAQLRASGYRVGGR